MNSTVNIILLNYNGYSDTIECIKSLKKLKYGNIRIVVVDNNSTDNSIAVLRGIKGIELIENDSNDGFAAGNNVGIKYCMDLGGEYFWLLNNDTVVEPDSLSHLLNTMNRDSTVGICGSKLIYYDDPARVQAYGGGYLNKWWGITKHIGQDADSSNSLNINNILSQIDYVVGASMFVRKSFIEEVGYMDEDYFLYFEEIDWAIRGSGQYSLGYSDNSIVYHKEGASIGSSSNKKKKKSILADYYGLRNRIKFTRKHYPLFLPTVAFGVILSIGKRLLQKDISRVCQLFRMFKKEMKVSEY